MSVLSSLGWWFPCPVELLVNTTSMPPPLLSCTGVRARASHSVHQTQAPLLKGACGRGGAARGRLGAHHQWQNSAHQPGRATPRPATTTDDASAAGVAAAWLSWHDALATSAATLHSIAHSLSIWRHAPGPLVLSGGTDRLTSVAAFQQRTRVCGSIRSEVAPIAAVQGNLGWLQREVKAGLRRAGGQGSTWAASQRRYLRPWSGTTSANGGQS